MGIMKGLDRAKQAIVLIIAFLFLFCSTAFAIAVIPGAEGFGMDTRAAYGSGNPTVYKVTNLDNSGSGSLRAACEASGSRVVIFETSGTIVLSTNILINDPYITVAGQTAPSPGITLRRAGIVIQTHDVLIQHIRIRPGDEAGGPSIEARDCIGVWDSGADPYNVVIDHCSFSWGLDLNVQLWYALHDVTFRYCIISEGIGEVAGQGHGMLIGDYATNVSVVRNLFAHNFDRSPLAKANTESEIINNVIYNWYWYATRGGAEGACDVNVIGNTYIPGPDDAGNNGITASAASMYVEDNIGPGRPTNTGNEWNAVNGSESYRSYSYAVTPNVMTILGVDDVEDHVLTYAGARAADRDSVDTRIVSEVTARTGTQIRSQTQVGGWPRLNVNTRSLTIPANPHNDDDSDGYTNLEEWLHRYSEMVEVPGEGEPPTSVTGLKITEND